MGSISFRYIVDDVDAAIRFYCTQLGFTELMHPAPEFAILQQDGARLLLSAPSGRGGGGKSLADGTPQASGGWNRISLEVTDLARLVERLRGAGVSFRTDLVIGIGGNQVLVEDPSGNAVELFEPVQQDAGESSRR